MSTPGATFEEAFSPVSAAVMPKPFQRVTAASAPPPCNQKQPQLPGASSPRSAQ